MVQTPATQNTMAGEWLIREDDEVAYTRESFEYDNSNGTATVVLPGGFPLKANGVPAVAADVNAAANATVPVIIGAVFEPVKIGPGEKAKVCAITRGFNVVNVSVLPGTDLVGGAFTGATLALRQAQLATHYTNLRWLCRVEPPQNSEHVT